MRCHLIHLPTKATTSTHDNNNSYQDDSRREGSLSVRTDDINHCNHKEPFDIWFPTEAGQTLTLYCRRVKRLRRLAV